MDISLVNVFLTMQCNLHCAFCSSNSHFGRKEYIPLHQLEKLAEQVKKIYSLKFNAPPGIRFTGGEPFIYKNILDAIDLFSFAPEIHITTNSTLVDQQMINELKKRGVKLILSVYPDLPNGKIRNSAGLERLLGSDLDCSPTLVVTKSKLQYIPSVFEKLEKWGAKILLINGLNPGGDDESLQVDDMLSPSEEEQLKEFIISKQNSSIQIFYNPPPVLTLTLEDDKVPACICAVGHLSVQTDGTITPCNTLTDVKVGNVKDGLKKSYRSATFKFLRELQNLTQNDLAPCFDCEFRKECNSGSRVHAYLRSRDWLEVDPNAPCNKSVQRLEIRNDRIKELYTQMISEQ